MNIFNFTPEEEKLFANRKELARYCFEKSTQNPVFFERIIEDFVDTLDEEGVKEYREIAESYEDEL